MFFILFNFFGIILSILFYFIYFILFYFIYFILFYFIFFYFLSFYLFYFIYFIQVTLLIYLFHVQNTPFLTGVFINDPLFLSFFSWKMEIIDADPNDPLCNFLLSNNLYFVLPNDILLWWNSTLFLCYYYVLSILWNQFWSSMCFVSLSVGFTISYLSYDELFSQSPWTQ